MIKSLKNYQLLALIIAQIFLIGVYKDGDYSDFQDFKAHANSLGYPVEEHFVETSDGFIISIHRIKSKNSTEQYANTFDQQIPDLKKKYPILMGHGLGGSSDAFIRNTEEKSIGFFLVNKGYDVFIMNSRGNKYSHQHKTFSNEQSEYWDFSFQEMAKYDLPAVSKYILEKVYKADSNDQSEERMKMNYIGHSQGCTIVLTALSEQYVPSHYFDEVVLMTPAAIVKNVNSPLGNLLKKHDILSALRERGMHQLAKMNTFSYYLCRSFSSFCQYSTSFATDSIDSPINYDLFYQLLYHYPSSVSTKAYIHFQQLMVAEKFQLFDYGQEKNIQIYKQNSPPEIRLNNITNKIHILAGTKDLATPLEDIYILKDQLVNSKNVTIVQYNEGHCSFVIGKNNDYLNYIPNIFL